jgi:cell division protein FtsB
MDIAAAGFFFLRAWHMRAWREGGCIGVCALPHRPAIPSFHRLPPMKNRNTLRNQLVLERKRRGRLFLLAFSLFFLFIVYNIFIDNMGFVKYLHLKAQERMMEQRINSLEAGIASLKEEISRINKDPFYIEKQAREDLGMAKPDEYIFKYDK